MESLRGKRCIHESIRKYIRAMHKITRTQRRTGASRLRFCLMQKLPMPHSLVLHESVQNGERLSPAFFYTVRQARWLFEKATSFHCLQQLFYSLRAWLRPTVHIIVSVKERKGTKICSQNASQAWATEGGSGRGLSHGILKFHIFLLTFLVEKCFSFSFKLVK